MNFAAFHVGPSLAPHLQASLQSWATFGHSIELYTYDEKLTLPPGVVRRDASEILPSSAIYTHGKGVGKGTIAAFSDIFRFRLCQERDVVWVDTDQLCLRGEWPEREYYFAWQSDEHLECNIAVFGAPRESELLREVIREIEAVDKAEAHFGQLGPVPFTKALKALGLEHLASATHDFYPIGLYECRYFLDPALRDEAEEKMRGSYAVHLWNEAWTRMRFPTFLRPPRGSFLEAIYQQHGVTIPIEAYVDDLDALTIRPEVPTVPLREYEELSTWAQDLERELKEVRAWAQSLDTASSPTLARRVRGRLSGRKTPHDETSTNS